MKKWVIIGILLLMISTVYGGNISKLWTFEVEGKGLISIDDEGDYIAVGDEDGNIYLYKKDGKLIWKNKIDGKVDAIYYGGEIVGVGSGKDVYIFDDDGEIIKQFSINDGNIAQLKCWVYKYYNDTHYYTIIGTDTGYVYYYEDDDLEWKYRTNGKITYLTYYSLIYFSSEDGRVYALYYNGRESWNFKCSGKPIISVYRPSSSSYEDYVAVGDSERVYLIKSYYSGGYHILWNESVNNPIVKISASKNGDYILASDTQNKLYCFDAEDGGKKWEIQLNETVIDLDAGEGNIFAVATNNTLYIIDNSGKIVKTLQIAGTDVGIPEETGDYVAVIDKHDSLYCLNRKGGILWNYDLKPKFDKLYVRDNFSIATVWVDVNNNSIYDDIHELSYIYLFYNKNGFISKDWIYSKISYIDFSIDNYVIAGKDGKLSFYNVNKGLLWTYREKKGIYSVKIVGSDIFAGSFNKILILKNGTKIASYEIEGIPISMDCYNGSLIVGCDNGNVYILKDNNTQLYKKVNNLRAVYLSNKPIIWGDKLYIGDKIVDNPITTVDANKNLIVVVGANKLFVYNTGGEKVWKFNIKAKKVSISNNNVISAVDENNLYIIYNGEIVSKIPVKDVNNLMISPSGKFVGVGGNYISMYDTGLRFVSINSTPKNVTVKINNKIVGNTPIVIPLFIGKYNITLEKDGYETISKTILIKGNSNFKYILQKIITTHPDNKTSSRTKQPLIIINQLPITINVSGIYLINKSFWNLNETAITIDADNVTIIGNFNVIDGIGKKTAIVCNGCNITLKDLILSDWDKDIFGNVKNATINNVKIIKDTNYVSYNEILDNKFRGALTLISEPSAIIYINDKFYGETPKEIILKPGNYNIRLVKIGYAPYIETITVKKGIKKFIAVKLNKTLPTLENFNHTPEVEIDISNNNISVNKYTNIRIQIKNPEENKLKMIAEVVLESDIPIVEGAESGGGGCYNSKVIISPGESKTLNYKIKGTKIGNHTIEITVYNFPEGNKSIYKSISKNITVYVYEPKLEESKSFIDHLLELLGWR